MFDLSTEPIEAIRSEIEQLERQPIPYLAIGNKADLCDQDHIAAFVELPNAIAISALTEKDVQKLEEAILQKVNRQALHHLGEITGEITTDDLLANIFSKFCIGK